MEKDRESQEGQNELYGRILKYTGIFGGIQGLSIVLSFVLTKIKSILIGAAGYGISENLNRSIDVVRNATGLGISYVAVPEISHSSNNSSDMAQKVLVTRSWALLTAILGLILSVVLCGVLSRSAFGTNAYSMQIAALSLAVCASALTGGELAVLRGAGLIKQIALSQLIASLFSLIVTVPVLYFLRLDGIAPVIILTGMASLVATSAFSMRAVPYKSKPFDLQVLKDGLGMIGFGVFFTLAAFVGSWAWLIIAGYLTRKGGPELTGTYSVGYMLVSYLTTMLLSVTDSDYYPRLCAAGNDARQMHPLVDSQIRVMSMLAAPVVAVFAIVMPLVVFVVLEYEKFQASVCLAQLAVVGLFFKSVSQPIAYIALARSDTKVYLLQEIACYIILILCVLAGYGLWGVKGVGLALAVWELLYLIIVLLIAKIRYRYVMPAENVRQILYQSLLVSAVSALCILPFSWYNAAAVAVLLFVSAVYSFRFFRLHTDLLNGKFLKLAHKIFGK